MILNRIREIRIQKKIENELKIDKVQSDSKVQSVLILFDENVDVKICKLIIEELKLDREQVKEINFSSKSNKETQNLNTTITKKQFSWFGKVKDKKISELIDFQFDLLINLTKGNLYLDYLTVLSNSQFKVGLSNSDTRFYDFMISTDLKNKTVFSNELKKYLKILNKI
jgi:hypothetical protein